MKNTIPHNKPCVDEQETQAVGRVIERSWLLSGPEVEKLENSFKKLTTAKYAVAVNSGSSALHLCLVALGIGKKDEVIVPTYTDSALLNVVYYTGATPIVVDSEKDNFNIDPILVKKSITKKTRAIIVPHTFGIPANIKSIASYGIPVIEDCAQAIGTQYNGKHVGINGVMGVFSFYATKPLSTGQGGLVVTNNKKYYEAIRDLINYDQRDNYIVRYNYQFNDVLASIGNVQLAKIPSFIRKRRSIALKYAAVLDAKKIQYWPNKNSENLNHYRFVIKLKDNATRDKVQAAFKDRGVTTISPFANFQMLHNLLKLPKRLYSHSENLSLTTLSIPVFPCLKDNDVAHITDTLTLLL